MRSLFSGNRHSAPLGPPGHSLDAHSPHHHAASSSPATAETLQAVRHRQREKQRHCVTQMMRAEKERDVAHEAAAPHHAAAAEADRRRMSDAADALAQQIMIIERIMEEFGLTLDLDEEARADRELLDDSRDAYHNHHHHHAYLDPHHAEQDGEDDVRDDDNDDDNDDDDHVRGDDQGDEDDGEDVDDEEQRRLAYEDAERAAQEQIDHVRHVNAVSAEYMMGNEVYDEDEAMRDLDELAKQTGRV